MDTCDITIVGAGAAGLAAAIFAGETCRQDGGASGQPRIVVLDGAATLGAKILISGGGRCNVTHAVVSPLDFNGSRHIVRNVLAAFDVAATRRWFAALGVELKREESGKLFPVTDSARTVLAALLRRCEELAIDVRPGQRVYAVQRNDTSCPLRPLDFTIQHVSGSLRAPQVILATGGRSLPRSGSDGAGWDIARSLGHHVTDTYPALVPLVLQSGMFHAALSGMSQPVELSTFADGTRIDRRTGSMLWTHFGVSGPVVLDASRHWVIARARGQQAEMRCNLFPGQHFEPVESWMHSGAAQRLPERLAALLARRAECDPTTPMGQLTRTQRRALVHTLTAFPLPVERDRGWNFAEVTAGGVPLEEIDYRTMQSRVVPGLYLVGEMLDCDGRIGGFNFQWAWATGYLAGRAAARAACGE
jgi:predicted Rossmann fold flavoprotein